MSDTQRTHSDIIGEKINASEAQSAGNASVVYHESAVPAMSNDKDGRSKTVLINHDLVPDAGDLLVDTVTFGPGVEVAEHYHQGTDHFFYILEGEGFIRIEGEEFPLEAGTVVWVGEGDRHKVYAKEGQQLRLLEYFSDNEHEVTQVEGEPHAWSPDS